MTKLNKILIINSVFLAVVLIVFVTFGFLMLPPKANDAKANDAKANDAKANDAKANDVKANDAKANDAKANDAKANDAKANDAKVKDTFPRKPEYVPLVVKFKITTIPVSWTTLAYNLAVFKSLPSSSSSPNAYFLLRIDGIQDPLIIPIVHQACQDRQVNQTILYDNSLIGRRTIVEIWDSRDSVAMDNIRALVSGIKFNVGAVQGAVSGSVSIDGKEIGKQLKISDKYICQAEITLGQTVGSVKPDSSGGTHNNCDFSFEILSFP